MKNPRVAIVHDYLHVFGGAEGVVNAIWQLYPNADIYSATYDAEVMKKACAFQKAKIHAPKWKGKLPGYGHKLLVANLPIYFQRLDLSEYDLVLSSSAHFAKGVRTNDSQLHVSYIHTPPRFLYGYLGEIRKRTKLYWKPVFWPIDTILRVIDKRFAKRPDYLLCNSREVQGRIKRFYDRDAMIINPFPNVQVSDSEYNESQESKGKYYLVVSRLAEYKNIDLCIKTCGKNNIPLKIAGTGPAEQRLQELADEYNSVEMLGFVADDERNNLYSKCKAFLCTVKDEDFGMATLEPMMYGKPVVALKEAGYLETVVDGQNGVFFEELTEDSLYDGISRLEKLTFDSDAIREHAQSFSKERFQREYKGYVDGKWQEFSKNR